MQTRDAANNPTGARVAQPAPDWEARYAALTTVLGHDTWRATADGRVIEISRTDDSLRDAGGHVDWLHAVHPQEAALVRHNWLADVISGSNHRSICRMRLGSDYQWVRVQASPVRSPDGAITEWVGLIVNVDEQRRTEERLRRSNDQRDHMLQACTDITQAGLDKRAFVWRAAQHARALVGADYAGLGTLVGDEIVFALADANDNEVPLVVHRSYSLSGQVLASRTAFICNDISQEPRSSPAATKKLDAKSLIIVPVEYKGRVVGVLLASAKRVDAFVDVDVHALEMLGGTLAAAIANADAFRERDLLLSELSVAVDHVTKSEALFRALTEYSGELLHVIDANGRFTYSSPSTGRILGYGPGEIRELGVMALVHPDDLAETQSCFSRLLETPDASATLEVRMRHKDGSWKHVEASCRNLVHVPPVNGIVCNARDIGARRELEKQLVQAQKMEAVGQLAGGVAHDFNNILTVITSYSEMLIEQLETGDMRDDLLEIRRAAYRAAELTGQLLAFSRKQVMRVEPVDLGGVVKSTEKMLRRVIRESILFDAIYPAEPATVMADRIQIEQVLMNLVVNASDAMQEGGRLRVIVESVPAAGHVSLRVIDTGVGMTEDIRSRIFDPFFTTKGEGKGTGLGLAVVYGIIQQLGGRIVVTSAPGQGSEFRIELPVVSQPAADDVQSDNSVSSGTETILLVEDNEPLADIATRVLHRFGYTVIPARSGIEARTLMARTPQPHVDLLVTDVVMPQMSGPELVKQLAQAGVRPSVLYMSGYADPVSYAADLDAATDFLPKPWTPRDLAQAVRRALDHAPVT